MDDAEAKENKPAVGKSRLKPSDKDIVGKGSAWGERERDLFKIQTEKEAIAVCELIEPKWFDFTTLKQSQIDCILHQMCNPND